MKEFTRTLVPALLLILPVSAWAQITVTGSLLGFEGETMQQAHIAVTGGPQDANVLVQAEDDGQFSFTLPVSGGYALYAMGVHHEILPLPLIIQESVPVQLDLQLAPKRISQVLDTVWVVAAESSGGSKSLMRLTSDGIYGAYLESPSDSFAYQIHGVTRGEETVVLAGSRADAVLLDPNGRYTDTQSDYFSLEKVKDQHVLIVFNSASLSGHSADPVLRSTPPEIADVFAAHMDMAEHAKLVDDAFWAFQSTERAREDLDDYRARKLQQAEMAKRKIAAENSGLGHQWRLMRYFDASMASGSDSLLSRRVLNEVPPASPFWSYAARHRIGASSLIRNLAGYANATSQVNEYLRQAIDNHADPRVRAQFLMAAVILADGGGDDKRKWNYYEELREGYGDSWQAERVRRKFSPDRALSVGNPVPDFAFVDLKDVTVTHSNQTLAGKVLLLDFWGTWCPPCIEKLPEMHEAYEKYKGAGFEILSVAVMDERATLDAFRKEQYPMPWLNTLLEDAEYESVAAKFEITSYPRPILVDRNGIIVGIDDELRDSKLMDVLAATLGPRE